jgi:threonine dehydrogenase-like Zn-dependent dehydrogenase
VSGARLERDLAEASLGCPSRARHADRIPHGAELPIGAMFSRNKGVRGGFAPARAYIPEMLPDVLEGRINPGRVLDYATDLEGIADAYAAMDERRAIKSLVRVGTI